MDAGKLFIFSWREQNAYHVLKEIRNVATPVVRSVVIYDVICTFRQNGGSTKLPATMTAAPRSVTRWCAAQNDIAPEVAVSTKALAYSHQ